MKRKVSIIVLLVALVLPGLTRGLFAAVQSGEVGMASSLYLPLVIGAPTVTTRVSVSSSGAQGNRTSHSASISADGRWIAFESSASTLVAGDVNEIEDIFVHDRQTGRTTRVSVASDGTQGDSWSRAPSISADGRWIAFYSEATTLVAGSTTQGQHVFVHDRQLGQTTRVSVTPDGTPGNNQSYYPLISADGRWIAFTSTATNLVAGDTNLRPDVFVHDRQSGQTTRASISSSGAQGNAPSGALAISSNGRFVVFSSSTSNLVVGDTNGFSDIFVHDRQTAQTTRVSVASNGAQSNDHSSLASISADGRWVVFSSDARNLMPNDSNGPFSDIFLHDRQTGQTTCVSVAPGGVQGYGDSDWPSISPDGRFVTFAADVGNLVAGDTNVAWDVFVHDRQSGQIERVSLAYDGSQGSGPSYGGHISADGRWVAFYSEAPNLVPDDTNRVGDIFVHDRGVAAQGE